MYPRKAKSQTVGNLYDLHCLQYLLSIFFFGGGGGRGGGGRGWNSIFPVSVLYYSRSYASFYDVKENAHILD